MVARLVHFCIAFARDLKNHEATSAPYGALFNAYSFLTTGGMVFTRAIRQVIFLAEDSAFHRLHPLAVLLFYGYARRRFWH